MNTNYCHTDVSFRMLLAGVLIIFLQCNAITGLAIPSDRKLDKRQESIQTSTPCSLSFFRYLFNSSVGERIRPPIPEGSSIFGVVLKSPDHYLPETKSSYGQKQEPIPLPSGQQHSLPIRPPSIGQKKEEFPPFSGQKPEPIPSANQKTEIASPYLPPIPPNDYLPANPNSPTFGSDSSVAETPFLPQSANEIPIIQKEKPPSVKLPSVKSPAATANGNNFVSAPVPKCECPTTAKNEENIPASNSETLPFVDISNVPIGDYIPPPINRVQSKTEPIQEYKPNTINGQPGETALRSNVPLPSVKGGKKTGYSPIAAPSEQLKGYEYPNDPFLTSGQPPSPPPPPLESYPIIPSQSKPSLSTAKPIIGYEYPKPSVPFPLPSVGSPYPYPSKPTLSPQPQPSEGYFYAKPQIPFDFPSKSASNFGTNFLDSNKVDSVAVQTGEDAGYNQGGLFQGEHFNSVNSQSAIDDVLVLHVK